MIDFDAFVKWAESNFTDVEVHGNEVKVNSIFCYDTKNHLWCNPSKNAYHCWKTEESGNLFELVSKASGCSYQEAVEMLNIDNNLRLLEDRVAKLFFDKPKTEKQSMIAFPKNTFMINHMPKNSHFRKRAEEYMASRHLPVGNLLFCMAGEYQNRIIIPYYDNYGNLVYWNGRDITGKAKLRYRGPKGDDVNVGKGDVLFAEVWPKEGEKIHLTEGEFDAMSLTKSGLVSAACGGKNLTDKQAGMLRCYEVCVCFDGDKSGASALNKMGDKLINKLIDNGIRNVSYVRPPIGLKDWNQMLSTYGEEIVNAYVKTKEQPFDPWTSNKLRVNK